MLPLDVQIMNKGLPATDFRKQALGYEFHDIDIDGITQCFELLHSRKSAVIQLLHRLDASCFIVRDIASPTEVFWSVRMSFLVHSPLGRIRDKRKNGRGSGAERDGGDIVHRTDADA